MKEKLLKVLYVIGWILFFAFCLFLAFCVGYYKYAKLKFFMGW